MFWKKVVSVGVYLFNENEPKFWRSCSLVCFLSFFFRPLGKYKLTFLSFLFIHRPMGKRTVSPEDRDIVKEVLPLPFSLPQASISNVFSFFFSSFFSSFFSNSMVLLSLIVHGRGWMMSPFINYAPLILDYVSIVVVVVGVVVVDVLVFEILTLFSFLF